MPGDLAEGCRPGGVKLWRDWRGIQPYDLHTSQSFPETAATALALQCSTPKVRMPAAPFQRS